MACPRPDRGAARADAFHLRKSFGVAIRSGTVARPGRDLELLVAELESLLGSTAATIRSPDYIVGRSRARREVDVSVRARVGSSELLVVLECRDRQSRQGIEWIEQLAVKARDVRADRAIAVSSSGFSEGARETAEREGIELRSIEELATDGLFSWLHPDAADVAVIERSAIVGLQVDVASDSAVSLRADTLENTRLRLAPGEEYGPEAVGELVLTTEKDAGRNPWDGAQVDGPPVRRGKTLRFVNAEERFQVETNQGWVDVLSMDVLYEVWRESRPTRRKSLRYTDATGVLAEVLELETEVDGTAVTFSLTRPVAANAGEFDPITLASSVRFNADVSSRDLAGDNEAS